MAEPRMMRIRGELARSPWPGGLPSLGPAVAARNGMPASKPYVYRGSGGSMTEEEVAAHLAAVRARLRGEG